MESFDLWSRWTWHYFTVAKRRLVAAKRCHTSLAGTPKYLYFKYSKIFYDIWILQIQQLHSDREPIPDAPAIYFVRPTEANIKRIAEDCAKQVIWVEWTTQNYEYLINLFHLFYFPFQVYRTAYLHFISRIERPVMEKLAQELVASNSVAMVSKIYDQYLDVIALEPSLFSLNIKDAFSLYNNPALNEQHIR